MPLKQTNKQTNKNQSAWLFKARCTIRDHASGNHEINFLIELTFRRTSKGIHPQPYIRVGREKWGASLSTNLYRESHPVLVFQSIWGNVKKRPCADKCHREECSNKRTILTAFLHINPFIEQQQQQISLFAWPNTYSIELYVCTSFNTSIGCTSLLHAPLLIPVGFHSWLGALPIAWTSRAPVQYLNYLLFSS